MRNYCIFMQKELMDNLRSKKILALGCVFAFFAITSPLLSRYMAEFIGLFAGGDDEMAQGMAAMFGDPSFGDSYANYYSNMSQVGALALVLVYMSSILGEKRASTREVLFARGLRPWQFVMAKFTVAGGVAVAASALSAAVAYAYTLALFGEAGNPWHVALGGLAYSLFLLVLLSSTLMFSALAKSTAASAVCGLMFFFLLALTSVFAGVGQYSPAGLMLASPMAISLGSVPDGLAGQIISSAALICLTLRGAVALAGRE